MQCPRCGAQVSLRIQYCGECDTQLNPPSDRERVPQGNRIGYSPKILDTAFADYKRKSTTWSFTFAGILAIIAIIGFPIHAVRSGELEWPVSLYYGLGIGGMFLLIALAQRIKGVLDCTWDGTVVFKDARRVRIFSRRGPARYKVVYKMIVCRDRGGIKRHIWRNIPGFYDYYLIGDRVRHHKGFSYYEKYDKSGDARILCPACLSFPPIDRDICPRCKCPLLK